MIHKSKDIFKLILWIRISIFKIICLLRNEVKRKCMELNSCATSNLLRILRFTKTKNSFLYNIIYVFTSLGNHGEK